MSALVLVVDDDPVILESIKDFLTLSNFRVLAATDGEHALSLLKDQTPDIIVSDIMMPGMDGYDFHQAVRHDRRWAAIPFLFLTARGTDEDVLRGVVEGADAYVIKPFDPETFLRILEARLKRASDIHMRVEDEIAKTRGLLLNVFSHELRTPLTIIHGYVDLLQAGQNSLSPENLEHITTAMRESTDRLVKLVQGLLLLSTLESGMGRMVFLAGLEEVNLKELCQVVLVNASPWALERGLTVELDCDDDLAVQSYSPYLAECIKQLIENAIRFNRDNGRICVRIRNHAGTIEIAVQDEGYGIPENEFGQIFERFHQVDRGRNEQQGVGIGLTIVREIVALHDGSIDVESDPGQGSTLRIWLPKDLNVTLPSQNQPGEEP